MDNYVRPSNVLKGKLQDLLLPEKVDDSLKVTGYQYHQRNNGGEDQCWRWGQSVNVSHG